MRGTRLQSMVVAALNLSRREVALQFLSMLPGQISFMASVVLIWTPNFENGSSVLTGFRSLSRLIGPSQKALFSILDHNQFHFKPQSFLQLIHFVTFTSSMASLSQNLSSPRNSQPSNMDPLPVSEHCLGYSLLWTYGESYKQGLREGEKRGWKRTSKKLGE